MRDTNRVTTFLATLGVLVLVATVAGEPADAISPDLPLSGADGGGRVVVSEIAPAGVHGARDGFFELENPAGRPIDLTGFAVFRCDGEGVRTRLTDPEADLRGVVLRAGERRVFATTRLDERGYGIIVIDPGGKTADAVAVYSDDPAPMMSECGGHAELPVTTAAALGESWQRVGSSASDPTWVRARATPGSGNAVPAPAHADVWIEEIAAAGPGGHGDDVLELRNAGSTPADLGGWRLYRCTATGAAPSDALQHVFAPGLSLAPGARLVVGGPGFPGLADVQTTTSLADTVSGALLTTADGRRVDGVGVSSREDTACQTGRVKLPASLDYRTGESWQRQDDGGFTTAGRTPGAPNAAGEGRIAASVSFLSAHGGRPGVAISEIATDPVIEGAVRHNFVEIANYGNLDVDISGWTLVACGADGFRRFDDLARIPAGTQLAAGTTWTAALTGTPAAADADARYETALELAGAGAWLQDASGERVDSVGIYHRNEMDGSVAQESPCTNGLPLPTFAVDRLRGETLQRTAFTGGDASDFAPGAATPGRMTAPQAHAPDDLVTQALALAHRRRAAEPTQIETAAAGSTAAAATAPHGQALEVVAAYAGATAAPLTTLATPGEREAGVTDLIARDDGYDLPYLRLRVRLPEQGATVAWQGRTVGRAEVRLSVWTPAPDRPGSGAWRVLDAAAGEGTGTDAATDAALRLDGAVREAEVADGVADLLVQVVPRAESAAADADGIADPADYDVAVGHLTDTQYYSEAYPEVYAAEVAWLAANADARKIGFVTHTGDLVQNWIDPGQPDDRARREYAVASRMQQVLDDAGIANSVLPGNHDNKRGVTNDLFNEYFGPDRYRDQPWYGGSIAAGDNSANWSRFEAAGAAFLMLSLPYAYGEREIAWAEDVVAAHPDANVILSTHEHLTPAGAGHDAERSSTSRWVSRGDELWERVVAPHRNVVLVLSGHFHGLGAIVTEDAGGIPGHTVVEALADYQEFRTPTGERATGFQRLLQVDLAAGVLAVDTFSVPLQATASHPYDYSQFLPDDGDEATPSNERPWRILAQGLQHRYTAADDAFAVSLSLQHAKAVATDALTVLPD